MQIRYTLFFFLAFTVSSYSQDDTAIPKIFFKNEKTVSAHLSTNGWGIGYRYGNRINFFEKKIYEGDFSIIKHAKEIKSSSSWFSSESFVYGKLNYVFDLRVGIGKQNEIFSKRDPGTVAVKYFYSVGPSVAFLKPIYYKIVDLNLDTVNYSYTVTEEKFNPGIHSAGEISGKASFFKGFDEITLVPGIFLKAGFNFEFSQNETTIHAIEVGANFQAYLKSLEIMAVEDNQQFLLSLYVSYRFGKITNAQEISEDYLKKRKKKFRLF